MNFDLKSQYLSIKEEAKSWKWWSSWLVIALGCAIMALGFILFMFPYKITPGGTGGMAVILHEIFPSIGQGWFVYMMDIPLLIIAFAVFGAVFGAKTVFAGIVTPLFMIVFPYLLYPDVAVQTPETLLWGRLNLADDLILATIFGGIFIGIGVGLVVRQQATTGGTDIVAMLIKKYAGVKFSTGMFFADAFVVISSIVVLVGINGESPTLPFYSLLGIYITAQVIDFVVEGRNNDKVLFVISDRQDELRSFIIHDLDRSGTLVKAKGLYTGQDRNLLFLVVSRRQIVQVKNRLKEIDPRMFLVVMDANETLGEGFRPFSEMKSV